MVYRRNARLETAEARWLMERALRFQQKAFDCSDTIPKDLAILLRYYTTYERSFHKALAALTKLQNDKKKAEIGFVSQRRKEEDLKIRKLIPAYRPLSAAIPPEPEQDALLEPSLEHRIGMRGQTAA